MPRVGRLEQRVFTAEEHHEWAKKLWDRMDRDHSGYITSQELNCEEFQDVLHSVINPRRNATVVVSYGRAEQNVRQAVDFCMRKADLNHDQSLSFAEFKAFLRVLRNENLAEHTANLVFALFDLDGDERLDKEEFTEICRYYLGRKPTAAEFEALWGSLDTSCLATDQVSREQYIAWLRTSAHPLFRQHAPGVEAGGGDEEEEEEEAAAEAARRRPEERGKDRLNGHGHRKVPMRPAPGMLSTQGVRYEPALGYRQPWNSRFRGKDTTMMNPTLPRPMRNYFSRPQSLPELGRFYSQYEGFDKHRRRFEALPEPRQKTHVLSTDLAGPEIAPERHMPGGRARDARGSPVLWNDSWQTTKAEMAKEKKDGPGSLLLRVPGRPPPFLFLGRDAPPG